MWQRKEKITFEDVVKNRVMFEIKMNDKITLIYSPQTVKQFPQDFLASLPEAVAWVKEQSNT